MMGWEEAYATMIGKKRAEQLRQLVLMRSLMTAVTMVGRLAPAFGTMCTVVCILYHPGCPPPAPMQPMAIAAPHATEPRA